jgi:hypothetical protein
MTMNLLNLILPALLAYQEVSLPQEVKSPVGSFVVITATFDGSDIKYIPLTEGLQILPPELLKDNKSFVAVANKAGTYKLMAMSCKDNKLSNPAYTIIKVGQEDKPNPPPDQLKSIFQSVYGADSSPNKETAKNLLLKGFTDLDESLGECKTVGDLNAKFKALVSNKIPANELPALRDIIKDHMKASFGLNPDVPLDQNKAVETISDILSALKSL